VHASVLPRFILSKMALTRPAYVVHTDDSKKRK
jgi:hypothetical protein